ncbi:hypothetical protein PINS_up014258 [Pythium insidiosum]|nr:hypothetical protein PINS_up014258 [Pythium insidiosum]
MSQNIGYQSPTGYGRLYAKTYIDGGNILNGTCRIGGLLPEGRQQHLTNGQFLRDAYVGDGPLKLFPSSDLKDCPRGSIYLRSDDEERTVGSGQALIDGLFPPDGTSPPLDSILTWNVKDYAIDYLAMNDRICPMMGYIANLSNAAPDFVRHRKDPATVKMEKEFYKRVGNFSWNSILECLSISRCNDLPLPPGVDEELFTKVFSEVETREAYFLLFNDSWYAKVAMQPAVNELLVKLDAALNGTSDAPRLSVMMAHDSTIIPMLAAIQRQHWDRKWTPYAGMLIMELYKTKAKSHAVRLLFMGQPLRIPECADTLCDIDDFMKAVDFARTPRNCTLPEDVSSLSTWSHHRRFTWSQYASTFILVGLVVLCAYLGIRSRREEKMRRLQGEDRAILLG